MAGIERRKLLVDGAKAAGALIGVSMLGTGLLAPETADAAVGFPESECNPENPEGMRILVVYGSELGTTGEVAVEIGRCLCAQGNTVDVRWVEHVHGMFDYDAVVVGSAIHYDRWMSEATHFVRHHEAVLRSLPVAYFFCCLAATQRVDAARRQVQEYVRKVSATSAVVTPVSVQGFAGALDYSRLSWLKRQLAKLVIGSKGVAEGDYRDWVAIRAWGHGLAPLLAGVPAAAR